VPVQGNSTIAVFERDGENAFAATIDPKVGALPDIGDSDGLDVTSAPTSEKFRHGLLVVQDGISRNGRQNFKYYAWSDVAGDRLRVDTTVPARAPGMARGSTSK
jgi:myo-inositol-hexaphosphate 3-phosphohydrolase